MTDPLPSLITEELANDKSLHTRQVGITQGLEKKRLFFIFISLALQLTFEVTAKKEIEFIAMLVALKRIKLFKISFILFGVHLIYNFNSI